MASGKRSSMLQSMCDIGTHTCVLMKRTSSPKTLQDRLNLQPYSCGPLLHHLVSPHLHYHNICRNNGQPSTKLNVRFQMLCVSSSAHPHTPSPPASVLKVTSVFAEPLTASYQHCTRGVMGRTQTTGSDVKFSRGLTAVGACAMILAVRTDKMMQ